MVSKKDRNVITGFGFNATKFRDCSAGINHGQSMKGKGTKGRDSDFPGANKINGNFFPRSA